jgi:hypothetical protein
MYSLFQLECGHLQLKVARKHPGQVSVVDQQHAKAMNAWRTTAERKASAKSSTVRIFSLSLEVADDSGPLWQSCSVTIGRAASG